MKFNKIYELRIQLPATTAQYGKLASRTENWIIIRPPTTVEFVIQRSVHAKSMSADIKIYNLSEDTRSKIFRDMYQLFNFAAPITAKNQPRYVELYAGYESDGLPLAPIFIGAIYYASSVRRGPNYVTMLTCKDLHIYQYIKMSKFQLDKEVSKADIIRRLYVDLMGSEAAAAGVIGGFTGTAKRGQVIFGPTFTTLSKLTNGNFFVDLGKPISLLPGETIDNPAVRVLSAETGLLNVPMKSDTLVIAELMFTPHLQVGQYVFVDGYKDRQFNGFYGVQGIHHSGIISGTHDTQTTTKATLWNGKTIVNISATGEKIG